MGIIIRQSVRGAFWSYLGIVIGYINVGIIMPQFFDTAQIGLVQLFASVSLIFAQFGTLGFNSVVNRLFPHFRNQERKHNGFLFLAIATGLTGFLVTAAGFYVLRPWVVESNLERSPLVVDYLWLMVPLIFMRILFSLLDNYNKVLYDSVTGTFWLDFMHKVINLTLIVLYALGVVDFRFFFMGYVVSMSLPVVPVIAVLVRRGQFSLQPQLSFLTPGLRRETGRTMLFGFINGLAGVILLNVDKVFVNQYLSLSDVGIFGVCALFATLIRVPYNSISRIATGIIAEAWKRDDRDHIREIYRKAATNQAIAGTLVFAGILVNLDNIFRILPPVYGDGRMVMVIYSAGMLVNTVIALAGNITESSKYFGFNTLFLTLSIGIQALLSMWLIPRFGINGAALATSLTLIINSLLQAALQKVAFGIYGVTSRILLVFLAGFAAVAAGVLLPAMPLIPDILCRSGLVILIFTAMILLMKLSPELHELLRSWTSRFTPQSRR
ncbi:MAG: polysaccharide biosynthesis C-terminal domain-containing protein [Prolixibacteraceae bacterium]|nr:polysaccharide biosynthesis C-terminal domain-containing protein [Prolixibacteraceae bacterium]HPJ78132.1 polysaccharide biosynthesis C-terminal domain-containing protein [Prolixibacteraceae bacterium]HRV87905.1 polysaccharide biosynthesis C-terminal domain-containing protein [Prolixibacteraceae bacterium]